MNPTARQTLPLRWVTGWWPLLAALGAVVAAHLVLTPGTEPFANNDETRHVMTGVFVRDALADLPAAAADPKGYAVRYYAQYPALGLLVWPPAFYLVEGAAMAVAGTGYGTARAVAAGFGLLAGAFAYRLAARTHGRRVAGLAVAFLGFAPLVFDLSRHVLLEVPTLALVLAAVFHFERYLAESRPRDAVLACLLAALAALTRFDGVVLLPLFLLRLVAARRLGLLLRGPVLLSVGLGLVLTAPYYVFTWREYGKGIEAAAATGTAPYSTGFLDPRNAVLYPAFVPGQVGWGMAAAAGLGAVVSLRRGWAGCGPYLGLIAATFLTFVPLAEPEPRHAVYWVPALALFAAVGVAAVWDRHRLAGLGCGAVVLGLTAAATNPGRSVRGYEEAARYVVEHGAGDRPVLMDGFLNGGFVYQVRRADPGRRVWVVRGDKLLYAVHSDPHGGYAEFAGTDAAVLDRVHRADPEFVVVEEPQLFFDLPAAARLRAVLRAHPDRFRLEHVVPIRSNHREFARGRLEVWRKVDRNPAADRAVDVPVLGLGRSVGAAR